MKEGILVSSEGKMATLIETKTGQKDVLVAYEPKPEEWAKVSKETFDTILKHNNDVSITSPKRI